MNFLKLPVNAGGADWSALTLTPPNRVNGSVVLERAARGPQTGGMRFRLPRAGGRAARSAHPADRRSRGQRMRVAIPLTAPCAWEKR